MVHLWTLFLVINAEPDYVDRLWALHANLCAIRNPGRGTRDYGEEMAADESAGQSTAAGQSTSAG